MRSFGLIALTALLFASQAEAASVRRFALVVGNNDGGTDVETLRYAQALLVAQDAAQAGNVGLWGACSDE